MALLRCQSGLERVVGGGVGGRLEAALGDETVGHPLEGTIIPVTYWDITVTATTNAALSLNDSLQILPSAK